MQSLIVCESLLSEYICNEKFNQLYHHKKFQQSIEQNTTNNSVLFVNEKYQEIFQNLNMKNDRPHCQEQNFEEEKNGGFNFNKEELTVLQQSMVSGSKGASSDKWFDHHHSNCSPQPLFEQIKHHQQKQRPSININSGLTATSKLYKNPHKAYIIKRTHHQQMNQTYTHNHTQPSIISSSHRSITKNNSNQKQNYQNKEQKQRSSFKQNHNKTTIPNVDFYDKVIRKDSSFHMNNCKSGTKQQSEIDNLSSERLSFTQSEESFNGESSSNQIIKSKNPTLKPKTSSPSSFNNQSNSKSPFYHQNNSNHNNNAQFLDKEFSPKVFHHHTEPNKDTLIKLLTPQEEEQQQQQYITKCENQQSNGQPLPINRKSYNSYDHQVNNYVNFLRDRKIKLEGVMKIFDLEKEQNGNTGGVKNQMLIAGLVEGNINDKMSSHKNTNTSSVYPIRSYDRSERHTYGGGQVNRNAVQMQQIISKKATMLTTFTNKTTTSTQNSNNKINNFTTDYDGSLLPINNQSKPTNVSLSSRSPNINSHQPNHQLNPTIPFKIKQCDDFTKSFLQKIIMSSPSPSKSSSKKGIAGNATAVDKNITSPTSKKIKDPMMGTNKTKKKINFKKETTDNDGMIESVKIVREKGNIEQQSDKSKNKNVRMNLNVNNADPSTQSSVSLTRTSIKTSNQNRSQSNRKIGNGKEAFGAVNGPNKVMVSSLKKSKLPPPSSKLHFDDQKFPTSIKENLISQTTKRESVKGKTTSTSNNLVSKFF